MRKILINLIRLPAVVKNIIANDTWSQVNASELHVLIDQNKQCFFFLNSLSYMWNEQMTKYHLMMHTIINPMESMRNKFKWLRSWKSILWVYKSVDSSRIVNKPNKFKHTQWIPWIRLTKWFFQVWNMFPTSSFNWKFRLKTIMN